MELIASGREADVYALGPDRVLRRYRHGGDSAPEAEVMAYLTGAGYPAPIVYDADGPDLVMERLDGPTLLSAALAGESTPDAVAAVIADLHERLHALPPRIAADPGDRILHLDLHPDNVMLTARGPVAIDWRNATEGPPDRDVAMSLLILAQVTLWPLDPAVTAAARQTLTALAASLKPPSPDAVAWVLAMRRANPTMSEAELAQLDRAVALVRPEPVA
ncbi:phosphotransferase [Asanoa sp. NPDC049573]|uniref:phosphotransferase n=1 Tax=Asanoa sp. NPDC049573 TaxID=3155396 RepID=UPI003429C67B